MISCPDSPPTCPRRDASTSSRVVQSPWPGCHHWQNVSPGKGAGVFCVGDELGAASGGKVVGVFLSQSIIGKEMSPLETPSLAWGGCLSRIPPR